jgi:hypothetical protein
MLELHRIEVAKGNQMAIKSRCNKKKARTCGLRSINSRKLLYNWQVGDEKSINNSC